jgi:cell wall-associated NlpC family hydrolase
MVERHSSFPTAVRRAVIGALLLAILPAAPALALQSAPKRAPSGHSAADQAALAHAKDLQLRLDQQYADLERLSELLVKADEVERRLRQEQADLQLRRHAAEQQLATSQKRIDLLRLGPPRQSELEATSQSLRQVRRRTLDLDRVRVRVAVHLVRQQRRSSGVQARRKQLDLLNKRLEATLKGLDRRLKGALEAQQRQVETQRRSAYDAWAASVGGLGQAAWMQSARAAGIAVAYAMRQLGKPYQWGAEGPSRFDCSGLTSSAYRAAGVAIPRVAADQFYAGAPVAVADLLAGDLVFYADNPSNPATIHHVGMYIGKGLMVHAPHTGDVVRVASIWRNGYAGAVRVIPGATRPGAAPPSTIRVPVPNPPMSTLPLPPPTAAPPTTGQSPTSSTRAPSTSAPPTTAPPRTTSGTSGTSSSSTTSTGTTTSTTTSTTEPATTAAPTTAPPTTAASTSSDQSSSTSEPTTTTDPPTTTAGSG